MRLPVLACSLLLSCLLLLAGGATADHDNNFCQLSPQSGIMLPAAPVNYTVAMAMRDEKGIRSSAYEYFNGQLQKTSLLMYTPEGNYRAVIDFNTKQILVVNLNETIKLLDSCKLQDMFSPDVLTPVTLGTRMYFLPSKFFFGGGSVNIESLGSRTIDGTAVNSYYSCYYWAHFDMSLKITWHFTAATPVRPLRVIVEAKDNSKGTTFSITHDISQFNPGNPRWSAASNPYMAPPGLYCRGLNSQGRTPQNLPDRFSMRIERLGEGSSDSTYMKEAYDFKSNMSLWLGFPPPTSGDRIKWGAGRLLYVHDFGRGLSYIRNEDMGNCTYERLTQPDWDSQKDGNQLRIRTPREFFDLDTDNVQYKGDGFTRGIYTDVFISYKNLDLGIEGLKFITTMEWYFANRTIVDLDTKKTVIQSIPMSVMIRSEASWLNSRMYIYDFEQNEVIFNRHDIAACFSKDAKMHFLLHFPLENDKVVKYVTEQPNEFTRLLVPIISTGLNVSPLRVLDPEVTVFGSTALLELTVTDKPPFQTNIEETPLNELEAAFNILISKGSILAPIFINGDLVVVTANRVTVIEERSNNLKSIGYSAGAVAGAAIGLLLAGLLAGLIAAFFYWR